MSPLKTAFAVIGLSAAFAAMAIAEPSTLPSRQAQLDDIAVFRTQFLAVDRSYSPAARAEAERRLALLSEKAGAESAAEFAVEICRIAALADNGHTQCISIPHSEVVPLQFWPFDGNFYVIAATTENADLLGARLISIDDAPFSAIRTVTRSLHGGLPAWRDLAATNFLSVPELLHAMNLAHVSTAATYGFATMDGRRITRRFEARADWSSASWQRLPAPDRAPWAFRDFSQPFRWRDAPEIDSVVIQLHQNFDADAVRLKDFLERAEAEREKLGRKNVVLDMRFNTGGDMLLARDFLVHWPVRLGNTGHFYVLIYGRTISAAMASVAYLKQSGGRQVTLVGEPPGDRLMFFAEGHPFQLPNSKITVMPATARNDFRDGCRRYSDCQAAVAQPNGPTGSPPEYARFVEHIPISVATLDPDIPAPLTIEDLAVGRDPAMEAVSLAIRGRDQ